MTAPPKFQSQPVRDPDGDSSNTPSPPGTPVGRVDKPDWGSSEDEDDHAYRSSIMDSEATPLGMSSMDKRGKLFEQNSLQHRSSYTSNASFLSRQTLNSRYSRRPSRYGKTPSESDGGRIVFTNPTVKLAVAMEMSAVLPSSLSVQKKKDSCMSRTCGGRHADVLPATCGHCGYICVFLLYLWVIIMQLMFFAHAPVPFAKWDNFEGDSKRGKAFEKFPLIPTRFLKETASGTLVKDQKLTVSPIPQLQHNCKRTPTESVPDLMNFDIHMWLDAEKLAKKRDEGGLEARTIYPVILGSSDFSDWWLLADRNHSTPQAYFRSHTPAEEYRVVTQVCNRRPEIQGNGFAPHTSVDSFTTEGTYLLACIAWDEKKIAWHRNNTVLTKEELRYCDAIGGVGGKPCMYGPGFDDIEVKGVGSNIFVGSMGSTTEAIHIAGADYSGTLQLAPCESGDPQFKHCVGAPKRFSEWVCHSCVDDSLDFVGEWPYMRPWPMPNGTETSTAPPSTLQIYKSFPPFDITLRGATNVTEQPRAYIVTAPLPSQGNHDLTGPWTKLYDDHGVKRPGWPHPVAGKTDAEFADALEEPTGLQIAIMDELSNQMKLQELNRLSISPVNPYGPRGRFYVVACMVNRTTYDGKFNFLPGQTVRGPPFNDRCVAVAGRCAYACVGNTDFADIPFCDDEGVIPHTLLVASLKPPFNDYLLIRFLLITLISSFGVKLLTYTPGVFTSYPHCQKYNHVMTQMLGYIVIAVPSAGESKSVVLRNLLGAVSCLPKHCSCRYHVVFVDEGHRKHVRVMWRKFCRVLELLLLLGVSEEDDGNHVYISGAEDMLLDSTQRARSTVILKMFMKFWVEDTRKMTLLKLEAKKLDPAVIPKISGQSALERTSQETGLDEDAFEKLQKLCSALSEDLQDMTKIPSNQHEDINEDWPSGEILGQGERESGEEVFFHGIDIDMGRRSADSIPILLQLPLRLHYLARSRPPEDERTIKVQEVAPGTWSYVLPEDAPWEDWLLLRKQACPYETGLEHTLMPDENFVPVWTSRGKAGGLNFALNYMHWYAGMIDEASREDRTFNVNRKGSEYSQSAMSNISGFNHDTLISTTQHVVFSICDARHQYQPDMMHRVIPYFFRPGGITRMFELDSQISFVQSPQYFPEIKESLDFLDNNNAQFFRLNCMLRNCCGGVSSCGTNGTWLVPPRDNESMWVRPVRVLSSVKTRQMHEFQYFDESCKIEDTASSLKNVLHGKRSQYSNYRLAYGLAKNPTDYLAAVQRWAEGGVVLSCQTFNCDLDQPNYYIYLFLVIYVWFIGILIRGLTTQGKFVTEFFFFKQWIDGWDELWNKFFTSIMTFISEDYVAVELDIHSGNFTNGIAIVVSLVVMVFVVVLVTEFSGCTKRMCKYHFFPTGLRWWGRLMICFDNLTYFLWFWTGVFWIAFNYANVFMARAYFYDASLMIAFAFVSQALSWGLILTASARNSKHEMLEANEVANICIDNIWRGTQLFYMTIPLIAYSIIMGVLDYLKWRNFNQDISYWVGGDRGVVSKGVVKYWTLLMICGAIFTWIWFLTDKLPEAGFAGVFVITNIGLDVMHPCAYLWLGDPQFLPEDVKKRLAGLKTCREKIKDGAWWRVKAFRIICNHWGVTFIKWLGPINQIVMPFLMIFLPTLGFNQAFTLLITAGQR